MPGKSLDWKGVVITVSNTQLPRYRNQQGVVRSTHAKLRFCWVDSGEG